MIRTSQLSSQTAIALIALAATIGQAAARDLKVVVTIKPIHALTASIMEGVGRPTLIVDATASPHTFALKPSAARDISAADVFIRVGPTVEPFTERLLQTIAVPTVTLIDTPGLTLRDRRTGTTFEAHEHEGHHGTADDHDESAVKDGHIWLDPANAKIMTERIATFLAGQDPEHATAYQANAAKLADRLDALDAELKAKLAPLAGRPFIVFHDATQYLEARYGLSALGSITVSPDVQPSVKRLSELRAKITGLSASCVFTEPYFNASLLNAVTEGTPARSGILDPEGLTLDPGPSLYATLMRDLADHLASCLSP